MKSTRLPDPPAPPRWRDGGADTHALEARAAALVEAAKGWPPLSARAKSRIHDGVAARRSGRRSRRPSWILVVAGAFVLCATTAGGAAIVWRRYLAPTPAEVPAPTGEATTQPVRRLSTRSAARGGDLALSPSPPPAPPAPAPSPSLPALLSPSAPALPSLLPSSSPGAETVPMAPPRRAGAAAIAHRPPSSAPAVGPAPSSAAAAAPPPSDVAPGPEPVPPSQPPSFLPRQTSGPATQAGASEASLLAEALRALRQRRDPLAGLAALDRHAREFPGGVLEPEAFLIRIEALIQLGDERSALGLLDRAFTLDRIGAELLLIRAELRAGAGRFREALTDFNTLRDGRLGPPAGDGAERVLYGRAVCLGRLGKEGHAREALLDYRERFPNGRFAVEVERLLVAPPPAPRP